MGSWRISIQFGDGADNGIRGLGEILTVKMSGCQGEKRIGRQVYCPQARRDKCHCQTLKLLNQNHKFAHWGNKFGHIELSKL